MSTVTMTDYETGSTIVALTVTSARSPPTADTTTDGCAATFCQVGGTVPTPAVTFGLDLEVFQDPTVARRI